MNVLIAIDSFKGSMTSVEAGNAARDGIKMAFPDAEVIVKPIADGGEGTVDALTLGLGGALRKVSVLNPLGRRIEAEYGVIGNTAVIEMAAAAGISLINKGELNPMRTTTYGVGEIIKDAIDQGCRNFIIGIGGSATNDGGVGMLQALGFEFLDKEGKSVPFGAESLGIISEIKDGKIIKELKECTFNIACDVTNPLCGDEGCSAVYGPQKGASPEDVAFMDAAMESYARVVMGKYKDADPNFPGAGAAGGMGFAFMTFLDGKLQSGIDMILKQIKIEEYIKDADLVITGEGRIDAQTAMGKAPVGVAALAKKHGKTVVALSGCVTKDARVCNSHGIDALFPIVRAACSLEEAMDNRAARENMAECAEQVMRLFCCGYNDK